MSVTREVSTHRFSVSPLTSRGGVQGGKDCRVASEITGFLEIASQPPWLPDEPVEGLGQEGWSNAKKPVVLGFCLWC